MWGDRNENDVSNCISLISRINNVMSTSEYNKIFGFRKDTIPDAKDLREGIQEFLKGENSVLRLNFSKVSFDYQVREILVNAIGNYLLNEARKGLYKDNPIITFMDEAHQFLNKSIADEYFSAKPLDAFEQISKEARKYGLFLCIATQMPRDIPLGTLSQMGTFVVHRLINEQDKKAVENAAVAEEKVAEKIDFSNVKIEPLFEEMIDFDTFAKADFRAVKILECEAVPKSKKLLKFTLDDGTDRKRTILSGIHEYYEPEDLIGKTAIAIVNLPPRKMMGIDSEGMLISAVHEEDGHEGLNLLMVNDRIPAGAKLY